MVLFDGQGSGANDLNFGDGVATLHSPPGMVSILEDGGDQVALYNTSNALYLPLSFSSYAGPGPAIPRPNRINPPQNVVSFVAWGVKPDGDESRAAFSGVWPVETYVDTQPDPGGERLQRGGTIARRPGYFGASPSDWAVYRPGEASQAGANSPAAPFLRNPSNGIATCDRRVTFGWETVQRITGYRFQIDDNANFSSPLVDTTPGVSTYTPTADLPLGTLYFSRQGLGRRQRRSRVLTGQLGDNSELRQPVGRVGPASVSAVERHAEASAQRHAYPEPGRRPGVWPSRWDSAHETDGDWTVGNGTPVRVSPLDNMYLYTCIDLDDRRLSRRQPEHGLHLLLVPR